MGRNVKPGISFYRMDSGHIINKKIRLLCNEFESDGYYIWSCALDYAYGKWGYYFDMNDKDELDLFASEYCKKKLSLVKEVISGCIRRGLFDKPVSDLFGILTSEMMQDVFIYATAERRRQGSIFEMRSDWLKIDFGDKIPVNIKIVHVNNQYNHCEESTDKTRQDETKTRQEVRAQRAPTARKKFIEPTVEEVEKYFLSTVGNAKTPGYWAADHCRNEASKFVDHYTANGWVQARGKPIKDWQAACRNWIRNALKGTFEKEAPSQKKSFAPSVSEPVEKIDKLKEEIDYLSERFIEDEKSVTTISVLPVHYNYLKQNGLINLIDSEREALEKIAVEKLNGKGNDKTIIELMKRLAVLEYFKKLKRETVTA